MYYKKINNLENQIQAIYNYWFSQFNFPNINDKPYKLDDGKFKWDNILKCNIPINWMIGSIAKNPLTKLIKSGVDKFEIKIYLATSDINNTTISEGTITDYKSRKSRANMQPSEYSVWFAKMKNSVKHLYLNPEMNVIIEKSILSTGFCGLQCDMFSFEYISSYIASPYFELRKDMLANGSTQESINNDDLEEIHILIPDVNTLKKYHNITKPFYSKISRNICENIKLVKLRDLLLNKLLSGELDVSNIDI